MRFRTALTLTLLLTIFVAAPLRADTINKNFDDGSIDPSLAVIEPSGFSVGVVSQTLE